MSPQDKSYITLSAALRQVLARPELEMDLKSSATSRQAMQKLGIDEDMRRELLNIFMDLERKPAGAAPESEGPPGGSHPEIETDRDFLFESFQQLRTAYRTSMTMSVTMFVIGVAFLVIAAVRSFTDPQSVVMTSVIGGIGVVQIVALFYRNPLTHIARTVSNTQQAKMAVMSYLLGISLLNQQIQAGGPTDAQVNKLIHLTESALGQLQTYAEVDETKSRAAKTPSSGQPAGKDGAGSEPD
jgi:hypothetical protein